MINITSEVYQNVAKQINSFDTQSSVQTAEVDIVDMLFVVEVEKYVESCSCVNTLSYGVYTLDEYETKRGYNLSPQLVNEDGDIIETNFSATKLAEYLN